MRVNISGTNFKPTAGIVGVCTDLVAMIATWVAHYASSTDIIFKVGMSVAVRMSVQGINKFMFKPTYLYIKTHNVTNLKYFGKTVQNPFTYTGSGTHWTRHLKYHGNNVSTEIVGFFTDKTKCKLAAIKFSIENNIVESKEWANLKIEELDGGDTSQTENYKKYVLAMPAIKKKCKWWNNGITQVHCEFPPDSTFTRGRLKFNNTGAGIGANLQKGKFWVNNGETEHMTTVIPKGFVKGRLCNKAFAGGNGRHSAKGTKWWNNGTESIMVVIPPDDTWVLGRIKN